jgi:hypothetical protein
MACGARDRPLRGGERHSETWRMRTALNYFKGRLDQVHVFTASSAAGVAVLRANHAKAWDTTRRGEPCPFTTMSILPRMTWSATARFRVDAAGAVR